MSNSEVFWKILVGAVGNEFLLSGTPSFYPFLRLPWDETVQYSSVHVMIFMFVFHGNERNRKCG